MGGDGGAERLEDGKGIGLYLGGRAGDVRCAGKRGERRGDVCACEGDELAGGK